MNLFFVTLLLLPISAQTTSSNILTGNDLKKAPLVELQQVLTKGSDWARPKWLCFSDKKIVLKASCNESLEGTSEDWTGALELYIKTPDAMYDYGLRHAVQLPECRKMLREILKVQKENLPFCIMGSSGHRPNAKGKTWIVNAVFYQLKSPLGYVIDMDFEPDAESK